MKKVVATLVLASLLLAGYVAFSNLAACDDSICEANAETKAVLGEYDKTRDATIVYEFVSEYRGEADASATRFTLVDWGNENPETMATLLQGWPGENRVDFFDGLRYAANQSDTSILFEIPDA